MTDAVAVITELPNPGEGEAFLIQWTLVNSQNGEGVRLPGYNDRSVQVTGTFGGGTVTMKGSNDGGTNYAGVRDPSSTALTFAAAGLKAVLEATRLIRPEVTGGDGTTALVVSMIVTRAKR